MTDSVIQTTLDEDLAKGKVIHTPETDHIRAERYWDFIDATVADTLSAAVPDTQTTIKVDGQSYAGKYQMITVISEGQDQRWVRVGQTCSLIHEPANSTDLAALTPIVTQENEILNLFGIHEGEGDFLAFVYTDISIDQRTALMAIADGDLETDIAGGSWTYHRRRFQGMDDFTARFIIVFRQTAWLKTWSDKVKMTERDTGGYQLQESNEATGVSETNRAAAFTAAQTASAATRNVKMVRLIERAKGERVIQQMEGRLYSETGTGDAVVLEEKAAIGRQSKSVLRVWWRRTSAARSTLVADGGAARSGFTYESQAYTHSLLRVTDHGDGAYTVYQLGTVVGGSSWSGMFEDEAETIMEHFVKAYRMYAGNDAYATQTVTHWRQIFSSEASAWGYADDTEADTGGGYKRATYYNDKNIVVHDGHVEYAGNSKWAGHKYQFESPAPSIATPDPT